MNTMQVCKYLKKPDDYNVEGCKYLQKQMITMQQVVNTYKNR